MDFNQKTILITGATSGIGLALVKELISFDCKIIVISRSEEKLIKTKEISPQKIFTYQCELANRQNLKEIYSDITDKFGTPDVAILNAGTSNKNLIENFELEGTINLINTNFTANICLLSYLLPEFINRNSGIIAGVSSLADNRSYSMSSVYSATKGAFTTYLEGLAIESKKYNYKIITIRPGFVKTPMTNKNNFSMPFIITPEKAAKIILKGLIKEKRYINFPKVYYFLTRIMNFIPNSIFEKSFSKISQ